jgi:N-acetylglucosaminyl-diphospho-decaprenol L-rhamnosyltransferase
MPKAFSSGEPETNDPWKRVTVVFVVHNSASILPETLDNLKDAHRVIIIDNNSDDDSAEVAFKLHPGAEVVRRTDNLGLTIASNQGFLMAKTEYVLHINPDIKFADGCLERMVQTADKNPNAAVVGPLLYNHQNDMELDVMHGNELRHQKIQVQPDGPFCTWFVTGAVCLWRRQALEELGGFDENIFLYYEDSDLCLRAAKADWSLVVEPRARGRHYGAQSGILSYKSCWRRDWNFAWGHLYFEAKHGDNVAVRRTGWKLIARYSWSALIGLLRLRPLKVVGPLARVAGTLHWLRGKPSWGR